MIQRQGPIKQESYQELKAKIDFLTKLVDELEYAVEHFNENTNMIDDVHVKLDVCTPCGYNQVLHRYCPQRSLLDVARQLFEKQLRHNGESKHIYDYYKMSMVGNNDALQWSFVTDINECVKIQGRITNSKTSIVMNPRSKTIVGFKSSLDELVIMAREITLYTTRFYLNQEKTVCL